MLWTVDPERDEPLFAQIAAQVRGAVASGELRTGDRLPSARVLATSLEVNLHTVLRAYQDLRDEGLLDLRRGRGAVIAGHADYAALDEPVAALVDAARRAGVPPTAATALVQAAFARATTPEGR
ncbi:GntR family transcriptional regulator [Cellulomonas sp. CW35]|uniref:GntR family transcriptional regulator n=1 Tax=Cellulomonas uda TaxID=1714 RepID=A0A4Y3KE16_CELUD|nr:MULTISPECIES: GntR family transcriptional regulator [Cellulomonas]ASR54181.1 GntR family transcriptional regulator [Cellulomonas sp. PSBB021]NII67017.1 GntR family transcriptional regulator [Cellulomonas uda]GEA82691.1 GntR family transcriptional regulator [Cellulomonas uda]